MSRFPVAAAVCLAALAACTHSPRKATPEEQRILDACAPKHAVRANGVELEYASHGPDDAPALLLIMGLGGQLTVWDPGFIELLVARGFRVITFDNRDVGLSTKFHEAGPVDVRGVFIKKSLGITPEVPYALSDLADDAAGLLEALKIEQAHVMGISMGGMIAQELTLRHPGKVLSLTSIMSTTNDPSLPSPKREAMDALNFKKAASREEAIEQGIRLWELLGGPRKGDREFLRARVLRTIDRCTYREGVGRQLAAIVAAPTRRARLAEIKVPATVIHGTADPLVPFAAGEDTAKHIPGAKFVPVEGMGHDLPRELWPQLADELLAVATRATPMPGR